jgi:hypothetical protein
VNVQYVDVDTGLIGTKQFMYVTDEPHTPLEAQQAAWDEYSDPDAIEAYGQRPVGTTTRNVYQTVAYNQGGN